MGIEHSRGRYLVLFGNLFPCTEILELVAESQHLLSGILLQEKEIHFLRTEHLCSVLVAGAFLVIKV